MQDNEALNGYEIGSLLGPKKARSFSSGQELYDSHSPRGGSIAS